MFKCRLAGASNLHVNAPFMIIMLFLGIYTYIYNTQYFIFIYFFFTIPSILFTQTKLLPKTVFISPSIHISSEVYTIPSKIVLIYNGFYSSHKHDSIFEIICGGQSFINVRCIIVIKKYDEYFMFITKKIFYDICRYIEFFFNV